ncbi:CRISPR-associated helicase/endonuclease Cas3 [Shimwellia blattae]|uniref:Putative helicase Cas3 n=1 Tax=Shimwellia blattae (strain ATCC 29907 / DSM 4481 / JCM 1650 / NBRC 105725 / CDC 9005-74) TaxID=630626 RepID=I2BC87_SHIBC|nr:CRISPR-associated helicase/endonuclease Cas3 [Shimwellia blattae]AFJ48141.1 putative helicase Cas3 [Shimwellia blattae DSM 4481 = NBRC 105725]GAB81875.1 hypothetical protein YgcB [Shimwellia blattae DSM 4481 = NBRC 105725]VDY65637.1 helicase Cas3 [Shimwellia blattae]VEC25183.1 helicase Cas3 [Shimwellia blattae]
MATIPDADFLHYWGKTNRTPDDKHSAPYHLLAWHCLDVAACGHYMVRNNLFQAREMLAACGLTGQDAENWIIWLLACHDIGKFARGFQRYAAFPGTPLVPPLAGVAAMERHDSLGFYLWQTLFSAWCNQENQLLADSAPENRRRYKSALTTWMQIATGHHGIPPDTLENKSALAFDAADIRAACHYLETLTRHFPFTLPQSWKTRDGQKTLKQHSWFFAGLTILADWMGSDQAQFPLLSEPMTIDTYWPLACEKAQRAVSRLPAPSAHSAYHDHRALFPFIDQLTPLQQQAATLDISAPGPQLMILEDVTGAGKTEAALILTHRLMAAGKGSGLYVGLPTMATANAMYTRLAQAYRALFATEASPSLVLAHGGRHMSAAFSQSLWQPTSTQAQDYAPDDPNTSAACHAWFADSRKKALLAEVGVGTLDQLLMGVMPFRHQSLRLLGMQNKILLLDEVHAYDGYMVKLLEGLLRFHAAQGGSAIILSATLPAALREKLLSAFESGAGFLPGGDSQPAGYPWLSHRTSHGLAEYQLATREEVRRTVAIDWLHSRDEALAVVHRAVAARQCVCWIRNTVDDATGIFRHLLNEGIIPKEDLLLFHSRFAFGDRMDIEEKTLSWFGKHTPQGARRGKVLIATQVVEQSLDLDFDWMISDLAPIDFLIQRAGRLQRHIRDARGRCKATLPDERHPPVLHILAPEWQPEAAPGWLGTELRSSGFVYQDQACLWRSQAMLRQFGEIRMPDNARQLVDGVYEQQISAPEGLQPLADLAFGKVLSQRAVAAQNLLLRDKGYARDASDFLWSDNREFSTRTGEESVDIYLAWRDDNGQLQPQASGGDFPWELSHLSVRLSWWQKHAASLDTPDDDTLAHFRTTHHRPAAQVVLVSPQGVAPWYSKQTGLGLADGEHLAG